MAQDGWVVTVLRWCSWRQKTEVRSRKSEEIGGSRILVDWCGFFNGVWSDLCTLVTLATEPNCVYPTDTRESGHRLRYAVQRSVFWELISLQVPF